MESNPERKPTGIEDMMIKEFIENQIRKRGIRFSIEATYVFVNPDYGTPLSRINSRYVDRCCNKRDKYDPELKRLMR